MAWNYCISKDSSVLDSVSFTLGLLYLNLPICHFLLCSCFHSNNANSDTYTVWCKRRWYSRGILLCSACESWLEIKLIKTSGLVLQQTTQYHYAIEKAQISFNSCLSNWCVIDDVINTSWPVVFHTYTISKLPGCGMTCLHLIYKEKSRLISLAKCSPPGVLFVVLTRAELFAVPLGVRMRGSSLEFLPGSGGGWTGLDGWQLGHISGGAGHRGPLSACFCTKCQFEHEGRIEWAKE